MNDESKLTFKAITPIGQEQAHTLAHEATTEKVQHERQDVGPDNVFVPYVDPGIQAIRDSIANKAANEKAAIKFEDIDEDTRLRLESFALAELVYLMQQALYEPERFKTCIVTALRASHEARLVKSGAASMLRKYMKKPDKFVNPALRLIKMVTDPNYVMESRGSISLESHGKREALVLALALQFYDDGKYNALDMVNVRAPEILIAFNKGIKDIDTVSTMKDILLLAYRAGIIQNSALKSALSNVAGKVRKVRDNHTGNEDDLMREVLYLAHAEGMRVDENIYVNLYNLLFVGMLQYDKGTLQRGGADTTMDRQVIEKIQQKRIEDAKTASNIRIALTTMLAHKGYNGNASAYSMLTDLLGDK